MTEDPTTTRNSTRTEWVTYAAEAYTALSDVVSLLCEGASQHDLNGKARDHWAAYDLAMAASEITMLGVVIRAISSGLIGPATAIVAIAHILRSVRYRLDGLLPPGVDTEVANSVPMRYLISLGRTPRLWNRVLDERPDLSQLLTGDVVLLRETIQRFCSERIEPRAQAIHRRDLDIPDDVINGLAEMGLFGLAIPEEFGGLRQPGQNDYLPTVVATEELSRSSLGAGGSLITRPEIFASALLAGGTESQRKRWLPEVASGRRLVAIAITEPGAGSDVARISTRCERANGGYVLNGAKTFATFAGKADLLLVLARTDQKEQLLHRGLSLFLVEKPRKDGHHFEVEQLGGGTLVGRAIPTIGYRGMHSYDLAFDNWRLAADSLVGEANGDGNGFYLQMAGLDAGRLQTAARAVGVMQAAHDAANEYAISRNAFGRRLMEIPRVSQMLAVTAVKTQMSRLFTYEVARSFDSTNASLMAGMVKAVSCRLAEEVTRDAMQVHGAYGYSEESAASRYFLDARVLTIFEGTEEVLATRVIFPRICAEGTSGLPELLRS